MDNDKLRGWMAWALVGILVPLVYLALRSPGASEAGPRATPERTMDSVPTVSVETIAHELAALERDLERKPDHAPVLLRMAQLARDLGRRDEAIRHLRGALESEPGNTAARLELGRALYEVGDLEGAIGETNRLLEAEPENVDALYNLGAIYANMGDDSRARELWERAEAIDADSLSGRRAGQGLARLSVPPMTGP